MFMPCYWLSNMLHVVKACIELWVSQMFGEVSLRRDMSKKRHWPLSLVKKSALLIALHFLVDCTEFERAHCFFSEEANWPRSATRIPCTQSSAIVLLLVVKQSRTSRKHPKFGGHTGLLLGQALIEPTRTKPSRTRDICQATDWLIA